MRKTRGESMKREGCHTAKYPRDKEFREISLEQRALDSGLAGMGEAKKHALER
jgi:hypothetical protein